MKRLFTTFLFAHLICVMGLAQVKSSYLYNTNKAYGVLDIRTRISSTNYFYLQEGKTFSYRESSPGVRTNTFNDMTTWDSSPYGQGNLRRKIDTKDLFIMNYRLLKPVGYTSTYSEGYPLIVLMHGAGERGNCLYNSCYHATWSWDPNVNSPAAPTTTIHKLLNNDHNVNQGGKQHLDARNLAGSKKPNDPTLAARAFPGFVLVPQMLNVWDSLNVQDVIRLVQLHIKQYKINPNKVYIHGLSIGGYAVYEAIKRAPWLFTAALPMSAVSEAANIFKHNEQGRVMHIPLWIFQGGTDKNPSPAWTEAIISKFKAAGGTPKYSLYATYGHAVWNKAYSEPEFFRWMLQKDKSNLHPLKGNTVIVRSKSIYPKLYLAEGFLKYQWQKDGVTLSTTSHYLTVTAPGKYRARFSRITSTPTSESQWNRWSDVVTITEGTTTTALAAAEPEAIMQDIGEEFSMDLYPNPVSGGDLNVHIHTSFEGPVKVQLIDQLGREVYGETVETEQLQGEISVPLSPTLPKGMYILWVNQGGRQLKERVMITD
jgi:hypothetical protein